MLDAEAGLPLGSGSTVDGCRLESLTPANVGIRGKSLSLKVGGDGIFALWLCILDAWSHVLAGALRVAGFSLFHLHATAWYCNGAER